MNLWERFKDCFRETEKKKVVLNKDEQIINVDVNGTYGYSIIKDHLGYEWEDDHVVGVNLDARAECYIEGYTFSKTVNYFMSIADGKTKLKAYENFLNMSKEQRREMMMDKLKGRLIGDIREHLKTVKGKDIDKLFKDMGVESLNVTVQIEKDEITKK